MLRLISATSTIAAVVIGVTSVAAAPTSISDVQSKATSSTLVKRVAKFSSEQAVSDAHRCLARVVYAESKGEPVQGQLAIAQVVLNRTRAGGRFPKTICSVVQQPGQFADLQRLVIDYSGETWKQAVGVARVAMSNQWEQIVGNALYFHATYVSPDWPFKRVARIGRHIFYR